MSERPGWDFLTAQIEARYPSSDRLVLRSPLPAQLEPHPCKQILACRAPDHWHLFGFGLTELVSKVSKIADQDGWGFELTVRVPIDGEGPPAWSIALLRMLIEYVDTSGRALREGDYF